MSGSTRSLSNPPKYYYGLTTKQQRHWRHATRKIQRNEKLRVQYPPYQPSSNIKIIHLHHQTEITTINQLIQQAKTTHRYTLDTESQKGQRENHGALVQIEMVHSIDHSTVILMEINHLPDVDSLLFKRIKELWSIIFSSRNEIITWGPFKNELKDFQHLEWMAIGKIKKINLQFLFQKWQDGTLTHPETERRIATTGVLMDTPGDDDYSDEEEFDASYGEQANTWSLQSAVDTAFKKFLDKLETVNYWNCGLDLTLETWRSRLFSKTYYDMQVETQQRIKMIDYAVHDCTAVTEIYFTIYPEKTTTTLTSSNETPATASTNTKRDYEDELSNISEDELIEFLKPKFDKKQETFRQPYEQLNELMITVTQQEADELNPPEVQQQPRTTRSTLSKSEKQKRKNDKLKEKRRTRPDFQNFIRRPIYRRYDYLKIRSQLRDDDIHTSHQIKINEDRLEVKIGFKSRAELERATTIMRTNYFSREQYMKRWEE